MIVTIGRNSDDKTNIQEKPNRRSRMGSATNNKRKKGKQGMREARINEDSFGAIEY